MASGASGQARRKSETEHKGKNPIVWWFTGLAMGLVVALVVHLEHSRPAADPEQATSETTETAAMDAPRFEFYQLLTEQEVGVESPEAETLDRSSALPLADGLDTESDNANASSAPSDDEVETEPTETAAAPSESESRYLLQAGSFRQTDDAESLKATLGLLGIDARIQRVELPGGETWHRVRIGPFTSLGRVNEVRARMATQNIESILLRSGG